MTSKRLYISRPGNGQIGGPGLGPGLGPGPEEPRNNRYICILISIDRVDN